MGLEWHVQLHEEGQFTAIIAFLPHVERVIDESCTGRGILCSK
jgi:hypothetical protein